MISISNADMGKQQAQNVYVALADGAALGSARLRLVTVADDPEPWWWSCLLCDSTFDPSSLQRGESVLLSFANGEKKIATVLDVLPGTDLRAPSSMEVFLVSLGALPSLCQ